MEAWAFLERLEPDIAFLQETVVPEDVANPGQLGISAISPAN